MSIMVHCNMKTSVPLQLALDDLIADLRHSRRLGDLGRLALLAYCEVRRWARHAGQPELAEFSAEMMTGNPHTSREAFLDFIDRLLFQLLHIQRELESTHKAGTAPATPAQRSITGSREAKSLVS